MQSSGWELHLISTHRRSTRIDCRENARLELAEALVEPPVYTRLGMETIKNHRIKSLLISGIITIVPWALLHLGAWAMGITFSK